MRSLSVLAACLLFPASAALAHEGEDHGAPLPAAHSPASAAHPRAEAASGDFEIVAVLADGKLTLYLDHFASNAPVAGARVEVEGSGLHGTATETQAGVYVMDAPTLPPARYGLTVAVETTDNADLLPVTLDIAPPTAASAHAPQQSGMLAWLGVGALALAGGAGWAARRRAREAV
jgi:hypothetical protein